MSGCSDGKIEDDEVGEQKVDDLKRTLKGNQKHKKVVKRELCGQYWILTSNWKLVKPLSVAVRASVGNAFLLPTEVRSPHRFPFLFGCVRSSGLTLPFPQPAVAPNFLSVDQTVKIHILTHLFPPVGI